MLTEKELIQLGDCLKQTQNSAEMMNNLATNLQDMQSKQIFQQIAEKDNQNAQLLGKHLNAGQTM